MNIIRLLGVIGFILMPIVIFSQTTITIREVCAENCINGIDDDNDGLADCLDSDCQERCNLCIIKSKSANWELLSIPRIVCDETEVTLVIDNVPVGYESIVWSDGSSGNVELEIIPDRDNPEYSVNIVDDEGCIETQKIILEFVSIEERITVETNKKDYVKVNGLLHLDKMFYCSDWIQPLKLSIDEVKPERGDYNYLWSTGETTSSILVHPPFDENPYSVEVSDFCRTHEEIFSVVNIECPCPGDPILEPVIAPT